MEKRKLGRRLKTEGAKLHRVELRLTNEQKELLDWAVVNTLNGSITNVLIKGLFEACNKNYKFTPEMYKKYYSGTHQ